MSTSESDDRTANGINGAGDYANPHKEQELRSALEEIWQDESPQTASSTDLADEVDGRLGTRHRGREDKAAGKD
ncbi:hypothetical protein VR010_04230 [Actinomycetaceae bacterium L2_0104]